MFFLKKEPDSFKLPETAGLVLHYIWATLAICMGCFVSLVRKSRGTGNISSLGAHRFLIKQVLKYNQLCFSGKFWAMCVVKVCTLVLNESRQRECCAVIRIFFLVGVQALFLQQQ